MESESTRAPMSTDLVSALDELGGDIAHQINNALTTIHGNLQTLVEKSKAWSAAPPQFNRALEYAKRGADQLAALAHRLEGEPGTLRLGSRGIKVWPLLSGLLSELTYSLDVMIDTDICIPDDIWPVNVNAEALKVALRNLVQEALEAMPRGGKLSFHAANVTVAELQARTAFAPPGQYVLLTVADSGCGMSDDLARRRYQRLANDGPGPCPRLSQAYDFAKRSGGGLNIQGGPEHGTTVELFLSRFAPAVISSDAARDATIEGRTILVVEDDDDVREYIVEALQELKYRVVSAPDAPSALEHLASGQGYVDLLLTDMNLPGMAGRTLARTATNKRPDLRVLLMSGNVRAPSLADFMPPVRVGWIAKPMTKAALGDELTRLLA